MGGCHGQDGEEVIHIHSAEDFLGYQEAGGVCHMSIHTILHTIHTIHHIQHIHGIHTGSTIRGIIHGNTPLS